MIKKFCVTLFEDSNEVAVTPKTWLCSNNTHCYWPPYRDSVKISRAVSKESSPSPDWEKYKIEVLKSYGE